MAKIEPLIDKYGTFARASFFADYLEVVALRDQRVKLSSLRDLIEETYPRVKRILRPGGDEEDLPDWKPTDLADEAWTCILQRADVLGDRYPFTIRREVLNRAAGLNPADSVYVGLLAITVSHAFSIMAPSLVEHLLEEVVSDSLENVGLKVGRLGPLSRSSGFDFVRTMDALGQALSIPINANATTRRNNANDEDVDIVAHLDWGTARSGRWLFVGQVTCAVSDDWRKKAQEPAVNDWQKFFGEVIAPVPFLAVPHHADDETFKYVTSISVNILDRTRIVQNLRQNTAAQRDVVDALMDAEYASFKV
ncbi:hypothetical protein [Microbacterium sp. Leaf320]|uniref:hypothetical protein n=1 Tax=Microbacterium sp. Leaf320 TaxID=1736334 RepID=UPI0007015B11|nr:hypothetical protein [Microbacterium sp. Leaf320]KQQ68470.1 hypothetical protein ASF63_00170 [Microbacterium sp. Leaf320]